MMNCTPRDRLLIQKLGTHHLFSTTQIGKLFFPEVALTTVRRRLRHLEKKGFLYRVNGLNGGGVAWTLTKKTSQAIGVDIPFRSFNRNTIHHDVMVSEVRLALENVGLGENWVPEHVLKSRSAKALDHEQKSVQIPDAMFTMKRGGQSSVMALEVELNGKDRFRYWNILSNYAKKRKLYAVWYILENPNIAKALEEAWRDTKKKHETGLVLLWSNLEEIINDPLNTRLHSGIQSILLREFASAPRVALPESRRISLERQEPAALVL